MTWHVVAEHSDADTASEVWTVSRDPRSCGWETDSGFSGYGLTKSDAEELANGANLVAAAKGQPSLFGPLLHAALHALRSYQYGNASPDLAKGIADQIEGALP